MSLQDSFRLPGSFLICAFLWMCRLPSHQSFKLSLNSSSGKEVDAIVGWAIDVHDGRMDGYDVDIVWLERSIERGREETEIVWACRPIYESSPISVGTFRLTTAY